jgi:hypothetical protein
VPITEEVEGDTRTRAVLDLFTFIKDQPEAQEPYRAAAEERAAKAARRERLRAIARLPRGRKPGSRPWQAQSMTKQQWLDAGNEVPVVLTRRQKVEARLRLKQR